MGIDSYTLTARWIFPVDGPPLPRGTITVRGDVIEAVEPHGVRTADVDLGNVAILPGFVNAHTHLDLSDALGKCPPTPDFTQWLRLVIAHRRQQTPEDVRQAIDIGLSQCLRYGTTLVGDISAGGASWDQVSRAPLRATVYHEVIGLTRERINEALDKADTWVACHSPIETCRPGLSPHAPYSVRFGIDMFWSLKSGQLTPIAIHLAESQEEIDLLKDRAGPLVEFLKEMSSWSPDGLAQGPSDVFAIFSRLPHVALIHCNYLSPNAVLGNSVVVYCPRTHAAFGHKPHPFRAFHSRGVHVALGTDSLASNPDLDILAEARLVHAKNSEFQLDALLKMATRDGAHALGWSKDTGSLTPGKSADLVLLPLLYDEPIDPHDLIFESALPIKAVIFRGRLTYSTDMSLSLPGPL